MSVDEHSEMHKYATDRVATKRKEETIDSRPLKSSRTCVYETCRALNEVFKLAEDLKKPI